MALLRIVLAVSAMLPTAADQVAAKGYSWTFYPDEYRRLEERDWPAMRDTLDAFVVVKRGDPVPDGMNARVSFTLARMAKIAWSPAGRDAAAAHLLTFVERVFEDVGNSEQDSERLRTCPGFDWHFGQALWCYGELGAALDGKRLHGLFAAGSTKGGDWPHYSRSAVLQVLDQRFSDPSLLTLAITFKEKTTPPLDSQERFYLEQAMLKHRLMAFSSPAEAWRYLWQVKQPADHRRVCTGDFRDDWSLAIRAFVTVFPDADEQIPFMLAEGSKDIFEKYAMLHGAILLTNQNRGFGKAVGEEFLQRLETAANNVSQAVPTRSDCNMISSSGNYLPELVDGMRHRTRPRPVPLSLRTTVSPSLGLWGWLLVGASLAGIIALAIGMKMRRRRTSQITRLGD